MNMHFPDWLEHWAQTNGLPLDAARQSGRLAIVLGRVRILLSPQAPHGWLLQARIADLPTEPRQRELLVDKAAAAATARMAVSASTLVIDPDGSALWLQAHLPQDAQVTTLETCLERLANDIEFWRAML